MWRGEPRDALLKKLKMYRLRAKVEIEARDQLGVYVESDGPSRQPAMPYADRAVTFADPRLAALGLRSIGAMAEMPANLPGAACLSSTHGWSWACRKAAISVSRKSSPWMPGWTN